jgi:uncharacterized protein
MIKHRVEFNTLTVVNRLNSHHPIEVYSFLEGVGSRFLQFIPLVERLPESDGSEEAVKAGHELAGPPDTDPGKPGVTRVTPWSVEAGQYGGFLCDVYDQWMKRDVGRVFVQAFDAALGIWAGYPASLCVFAETCGQSLAVEHNGDVYACDHYVYPEHRLGNLRSHTIRDMVRSGQQTAFGAAKRDALPGCCRECRWLFACRGECPKHRFDHAPNGEPGLNYLCPSYKLFFSHIEPTMDVMVRLLREERAPAEIMQILARRRSAVRHVGRNDPCPCGSARKYKQCCGRTG